MSARSLRLELAPSTRLACLIVGAHGVAALCLAAVLPGWAAWPAATGVIGLGLASAWKHALLRSAASVRTLHISGAGVEIGLGSREAVAAEVAERRYVGRHLVLLPMRLPRRRILLVSRDMLEPDSFRRLRIWALWGKLPAVAGTQLPA